MTRKEYLICLGWTVAKCRERITSARAEWRKVDRAQPNAFTYRFLFASLYLKYKQQLAILS